MQTERRKLIQNAVYVPEKDRYYKSGNVHDFVHVELEDGKSFFLDGGTEYLRRGGDFELFMNGRVQERNLHEDSPADEILDRFLWGTYGLEGSNERKWVLIKDCSADHLEAILKTQRHIKGKLVEKIVQYWLDKKREKE